MAFEEARQYLEKHFEKRGEDLRGGKRLKWSTYEFGDLKEQLDKFSRDDAHGKWKGEHEQKQPDMNKLMGISSQIAWLCGCARDIRMQFSAGADDKVRTSVDHARFEVSYLEWKAKALKRLKELDKEREKKL